ncbi:hypothetical protein E3O44_09180 [Cryobacterium algoricola]|uniref:Alpha/beta hydrolase n=1 Tax=Cryobacterium algoricola TaxID=1259183 RepID=A0ABY2IF98_9MICO|nr:hypothetical protein [Cryobacterium algoricola]TFB87284.1 hypothetical protein E3O44_09180 [Cryobacterium algoricola]
MMWTRETPGAGEPWGIRNEASVRERRADDLRTVQSQLADVLADAGSADWTAQSRDAFVARVETLGPGLALLIDGLEEQGAALRRYGADVEQIQDEQRSLEYRRGEAHSRYWAFQRQLQALPMDDPVFTVDASIPVERARLGAHMDSERSILRNVDAQWNELVVRRRAADSFCAQQLGSVAVLGGLSSVTAAVGRGATATEILVSLAALSAEDLQVFLRSHPDLVRGFQDNEPTPSVVKGWWDALDPGQQTALLAGAPAIIGALDGVPWPARFTANKTNIAQARRDNAATIASLREQIAAVPQGKSFVPQKVDLQNALAAALKRELTYQVMAGDDHQVLLFDPAGNGRYAEVHGTLSEKTANIAVIVNGTTLDMDTVLDYDDRARLLFDESVRRGSAPLVTITWMGTDFPSWETYFPSNRDQFAIDGGPRLARFVSGLDELSAAPIGVVGHSAGGAIVGSAEVTGMPAAYVMHIESAGAGPGVHTIEDYANPAIERFSMTSPDDPIQDVQESHVLGADPDTLAGVRTLDSGYSSISEMSPVVGLIVGSQAHNDVFNQDSRGWTEIFTRLTDERMR